jgi:selT/selW/selH-like putative selenoprotein
MALEGRTGPIHVTGGLYPASAQAKLIAQTTSLLWFAGLAIMFFGTQIFKMIGMEEPRLVLQMKENKVMVLGALFMLNNLGNSQLATGAFEIFVDNELVFSKINTGRTPSQDDMDKLVLLLAGSN